jgi:hypothetical protein
MAGSEVASIVTPICSGLVTLGLAYIGYLRLKAQTTSVRSDVRDVHTLVNNQLDTQLTRNDQLTRTLTAAGVDVPARPPEQERMATESNHQPPPG